ncbi:MAG TPA: GTP cyclohydrolase I FolE [Phycisphaerales bacterium]|nr:GTP cyclohydrolase I FolE [Phycisphaerales bacterium]HMP37604.1 GTP cyclohydrolase I FolE [Phycisphaerales bacterium]
MNPIPLPSRRHDPAANGRLRAGNGQRRPASPRWARQAVSSPPAMTSLDPDASTAADHVRGLLRFIGEDPEREGLLDTPKRVVMAMRDHFSGYGQDPMEILSKTFTEVEGYDELVLLTDIELHSHCEHHMVPFVGRAHVGYIPNGRVTGLSKLARVVDIFAKRLQVQEKLTAQIAKSIQDALAPHGVAVVLQCQHFCMCYRGVRKPGAWTTTSKLHGIFLKSAAARAELFQLIEMRRER